MPQRNLFAWLIGMVLAVPSHAAMQEPLLQIHGKPYFGGQVTIQLKAPEFGGNPAALAYGLEPLALPAITGKGPWFIGDLYKVLLLGTVPPNGVINLMIDMPPETPGLEGLAVVAQGFAAPRLSNPAELRLDRPYLTASHGIEILPPLPVPGAGFGDQVCAGDFDGDGHEDIAVGAAFENYQSVSVSGSVYVMWGPDWTMFESIRPPEPKVFGGFGFGLGAADFDQDGRDDLVITQSGADPFGPTDFARVYLARGGADRSISPALVAFSPTAGLDAGNFGRAVATGDITGDGIPDAVIGAQGTTVNGTAFSGAVMVLPGPALDTSVVIENPTPVGADFFGTALVLADVNNDQHLDIIEASERADAIDSSSNELVVNAGELHVLFGPELSSWAVVGSPHGSLSDERFGQDVAVADIDGDGSAELITANSLDEGVILWAGAPSTVIPKPVDLFGGGLSDSSYGYSVGVLDVNFDGRDDVVISDPFDGELQLCSASSAGTFWVALAPYYSTLVVAEAPGGACGDLFGWAVLASDLNGDNLEDVLVGVRAADDVSSGAANVGKVVVFLSD